MNPVDAVMHLQSVKDSIDEQVTISLAHIARIELTPDEVTEFTNDLSAVLDYMHALIEVDTENVPPLVSPISYPLSLREDIPAQQDLNSTSSLLSLAHDQQDAFFKVPTVMHQENE